MHISLRARAREREAYLGDGCRSFVRGDTSHYSLSREGTANSATNYGGSRRRLPAARSRFFSPPAEANDAEVGGYGGREPMLRLARCSRRRAHPNARRTRLSLNVIHARKAGLLEKLPSPDRAIIGWNLIRNLFASRSRIESFCFITYVKNFCDVKGRQGGGG